MNDLRPLCLSDSSTLCLVEFNYRPITFPLLLLTALCVFVSAFLVLLYTKYTVNDDRRNIRLGLYFLVC